MATVHFYEKPGCINNTRQKQKLVAAGHLLIVHDLLQFPWSDHRQLLRDFFADLPIPQWFNPSAPAIKNGNIDPAAATEAQALDWMVVDPLLIRRPLMEVDNWRCAGFDLDDLNVRLNLAVDKTEANGDLETCPRSHDTKAGQT